MEKKKQQIVNQIRDRVSLSTFNNFGQVLDFGQLITDQLKNTYSASSIWRFLFIGWCFVNQHWKKTEILLK